MKQHLITLALCSLAWTGASTTALASDSIDAAAPAEDMLERALDRLQDLARERNATRSDYERVAKLIIERAGEVIEAEEHFAAFESDLWTTLRRAVNHLEDKARSKGATREDYEAALKVLLDSATSLGGTSLMLDARSDVRRALAWLAEQASERNATREQYEDVADQIIARARAFFGPDEEEFMMFATSLESRLNDLLSRLQDAIDDGNVTKDQYMKIVDMLRSRARDVQAI